MVSEETRSVVESAKKIYAEKLREQLERTHMNRYVAIEPVSGDYFIGDTFSGAVASARKAHPDRITFVERVGHQAAIHMGGATN